MREAIILESLIPSLRVLSWAQVLDDFGILVPFLQEASELLPVPFKHFSSNHTPASRTWSRSIVAAQAQLRRDLVLFGSGLAAAELGGAWRRVGLHRSQWNLKKDDGFAVFLEA